MRTKTQTETCPHCGYRWIGTWETNKQERVCVHCKKEFRRYRNEAGENVCSLRPKNIGR